MMSDQVLSISGMLEEWEREMSEGRPTFYTKFENAFFHASRVETRG